VNDDDPAPVTPVDATTLKASQEHLRTREERYRTLFNAIDEGFIVIEMVRDELGTVVDHRYLEANAAVEAITGQAGLAGRLASEAFPGYKLAWHDMFARVLESGQPMRFTAEVQRWGRWIDFSITRIGDKGSDQVGLFVRDISSAMRREEALRRNEERYRALFNSIEQGFAILELLYDDTGTANDYRFLEVNPALERLTGLRDVVGKRICEVVAQPNLEWIARYGNVARTGEPVHLADYSSTLDAWYDISVVRVGEAETNQVALLFEDVTEQRRHDEALRQLAEDLARANLRQHEFLATLAHELRNPLAPIRTSLELMRMSPTPATIARAQDIMGRQVDHLVHLVDDLLDLARVTSGKIELKKAPVLLADLLRAACEAALPLIQSRHHTFHQHIDADAMWLDADANRLVQVIGNLLTNAAKYTPEHGTITLTAKRVANEAVITVADNGIGIAPDAQALVFEMFGQVRTGNQLAQGGLGIGLNLVKRLTEKHGGSVSVSSAGDGKGSAFTVTLPLREPPAIEPASLSGKRPPAASEAARALRVLVVDDNEDAADMLGHILRADGHEVHVAYDARQALAHAAREQPDVAVLDIGMPGMDGHQLARALRTELGLARTRLIALTGWGAESDRQKSRAAGFDAHLTKPVSVELLQAEIARFI
jgi:PAS domain S-box-containing protein